MKRLILIAIIALLTACSKVEESNAYYTFEEEYILFEGIIDNVPFIIDISEHCVWTLYNAGMEDEGYEWNYRYESFNENGIQHTIYKEIIYSLDGIYEGDSGQFWTINELRPTLGWNIEYNYNTPDIKPFINVWENHHITSNMKFIIKYKHRIYSI